MKETQRQVYRSMQGKEVDMHKIVMQNEMTVAVGNVKVNARGDELGAGGKIIRKREDVLRDSNQSTPDQINARKSVEDMDPEGNE
ncbi:hypothetical protein UFOVP181_249 [uncultured Caudovirales phage]|uniref:Uncharacterized protein n=1 Tax=uncultured Caudovirales phage TaxID=2100421 RepID=A0A6J5L1P6_9CAUD|nr:hypothetical protein UFOVP57_390 [uncultured Caudovirales phage]CAB5208925.1 hypothetical protein UFOVP181_249 [uncultured Caudovirales phage]